MTNETETKPTAYYLAPTRWQRFWRWAGFHYHMGEEPEGCEDQRFVRTDMSLHFDLADRLRLLISGKLLVRSTVYSEEPPPKAPKSRMDWYIARPGDDWP